MLDYFEVENSGLGLGAEAGEGHEEDEVFRSANRFISKQADEGTAMGEVCRKAGISTATFYNWRKKYGDLKVNQVKRMKELEADIAPYLI
jgi:hypothetical protein